MNPTPGASNSSTELQQLESHFTELYRKSKDISEYLSLNDIAFIENYKTQFKDIALKIDEDFAASQNKKVDTRNSGLTFNAVNVISRLQFLKAPVVRPEKLKTGEFRLSSSLLYQGDMVNGEPNGKGRIYDVNTKLLVYEGDVKKGVYDGNGKLYKGKYLYEEGVYKNGVISEGIRYLENGTIYSGLFENNECVGQGRIVFPNGFFVSGYFFKNNEVKYDYTIPIPSAKQPMSKGIEHAPLDNVSYFSDTGVFISESGSHGYYFYYNGDVFCGEIVNDVPENGVLYKYYEVKFVPMQVGSGVVRLTYKKPEMVVEEDYKYFKMA